MKKDMIAAQAKCFIRLEYADQRDLLHQMLSDGHFGKYSLNQVLEGVLERDRLPGCAVGSGIYLPHVRLPELSDFYVAIATLRRPLAIETPDDEAIEIVCLLIIPEERPMEALKFMAEFSSCLGKKELRVSLVNAENVAGVDHFMSELIKRDPLTLYARDLMSPCEEFATPEMPLKEATMRMMQAKFDAMPVLENGILKGELNCNELFKIGIPDFFNHLKSVSFIRYFDPFENYFKIEAASCVRDVMNPDIPTFDAGATLIEIVFAISVQKLPLIYVTGKDGKLLGLISRASILSRIINF